MSSAARDADPKPARGRRAGLVAGALAALAFGAAGFWAARGGLVDPAAFFSHDKTAAEGPAFVPIAPIMISLPPGGDARHLRFSGQLEVDPAHAAEVAAAMPRVVDALNAYLRAVEARDLGTPSALLRMRAQMLRRAQVVTGEGQVRDLLVAEFVLN